MITKKVKSFSVDEEPYTRLYEMFRVNLTDITVSYYVNKHIKELLSYFEAIESEIAKGAFTVPLAFIIDSFAKQAVIKRLSAEPLPGAEKSSLQIEIEDWQKSYDLYREEEAGKKYNKSAKTNKTYPISDVVKYAAKVAVLQITKGRDLTDEEYKNALEGYGGQEFRKHLRENILPPLEKIDLYGRAEKAIKARRSKSKKDE
jgi:hypothetical protein